jgi:DnaJ domain
LAKVIVERGSGYWGWMRGAVIEVDGKRCAKVSRNSRVEFAVGPGIHTIQVRMARVKSSPIKVMINLKDVVGFACDLSGISSQPQISLKKAFAFQKNEPEGNKANGERADRAEKTHRRGVASWSMVLDISADASMEEIRAAYLTRINEYHPDKVAALGKEIREVAERKSKEINAAYSVALEERGSAKAR